MSHQLLGIDNLGSTRPCAIGSSGSLAMRTRRAEPRQKGSVEVHRVSPTLSFTTPHKKKKSHAMGFCNGL